MIAPVSAAGASPSSIRARQPLDDGGLADARVADEQRVVLAPPRQHVQRPLDLRLPADQRIDLARRARARSG